MYYASRQFPFSQLFSVGVTAVVFGILALALGVLDLVYMMMNFADGYCTILSYPDWTCPEDPCDSEFFVWVYTCPGIWTGFFIMLFGALNASLVYASGDSLKAKRDGAGVLAALVAFPLGPTALALTGIRLYFFFDTFFCVPTPDPLSGVGGELTIPDYAAFIVPLAVAAMVLLAWILALVSLVALCRYGRLSLADVPRKPYRPRYDDYDDYGYEPRQSYLRRPYVLSEPHEYPYALGPDRGQYAYRSYMGPRPRPDYTYGRRYSDPYVDTYAMRDLANRYYTTTTYDRF